MMPPATVFQRRSPAACSQDGGRYETVRRVADPLFGHPGYSGKGGVSPSGNATWNTFSMFPISV
jgi:hypothetical protein